MSNKKITSRALLTSALAMLICISMLIGTTFAWFTDTASTAVNKIQAGTLDVKLLAEDGVTSLEGQTLQWKKAAGHESEEVLWEPGCTYELPAVVIKNDGNLALKYKIFITGIDGDAMLNDVIDWTIEVDDVAVDLDVYEGKLLHKDDYHTLTIAGHMRETAGNEYQGLSIDGIGITVVATQVSSEYDSNGNGYDADAVLPVIANAVGNLNVTSTSIQNNATVSTEQTISGGAMSVTYPAGAKLNNTSTVTGDTEKKTSVAQSLNYVGETPSSAMSGITLDDGKAVAQYELTLPVAEDNDTPVTVTIEYTAGLTGVAVYHNGTLLTVTANADGESATYDPISGVLTLTLKHASPIDIVYNAIMPANAKFVKTLDELEAAVENLHDGDYIAFGANIVQDKVDTTSGQITFARASDTVGDIEATLDLNGYVFDGQIGGFSFGNDGITVNVIGTEKVVAEYYQHETGHHMVKAYAVFNYSGKTILKSGLFESNNACVSVYGGEVVIDGGDIHNTAPGSRGIYACNDPKITINGGNFSCEEGGTIFMTEPYRTNAGPVITINDGIFDASKGACFLFVYGKASDAGEIAQVIINGGNFIMPTADGDWAQDMDGTLVAGSNRIIIRGGTFNVDPTAYVDTANYNVINNGSTWTVTAK
ncbi:MAG: SipW-dependent-type signal peptide-containing protein [Eubacteriales bacterium]